MKKSLVAVVSALTVAAIVATASQAQASANASVLETPPALATQLTGTVYNLDRKTVSRADVWILNRRSGETVAKTTTDKAGHFKFAPVAIGDYTVLVERRDIGRGMVEFTVTRGRTPAFQVVLQPQDLR